MIFTLTIDNLNNAEAAESPEAATADYLTAVAARVRDGSLDGKVMDGNGNAIGWFRFSSDLFRADEDEDGGLDSEYDEYRRPKFDA